MKKEPIPFPGKMFIKTGDEVIIISGKDKGRTGRVTRVYPKTGKVVVEGLNIVVKHVKAQPTQSNPNPESGRIEQSAPILACKVALVNHEGKPTRIRMRINDDGTKTRIAVKGGQPIPEPERQR
ncbi:MAG: 50S ribosomal protein L24 [Capsulimonadales bacterium]|nr:50S ribosomal protein L24 [Capsulimonadales bacterium]